MAEDRLVQMGFLTGSLRPWDDAKETQDLVTMPRGARIHLGDLDIGLVLSPSFLGTWGHLQATILQVWETLEQRVPTFLTLWSFSTVHVVPTPNVK